MSWLAWAVDLTRPIRLHEQWTDCSHLQRHCQVCQARLLRNCWSLRVKYVVCEYHAVLQRDRDTIRVSSPPAELEVVRLYDLDVADDYSPTLEVKHNPAVRIGRMAVHELVQLEPAQRYWLQWPKHLRRRDESCLEQCPDVSSYDVNPRPTVDYFVYLRPSCTARTWEESELCWVYQLSWDLGLAEEVWPALEWDQSFQCQEDEYFVGWTLQDPTGSS